MGIKTVLQVSNNLEYLKRCVFQCIKNFENLNFVKSKSLKEIKKCLQDGGYKDLARVQQYMYINLLDWFD